MHTQSRKKTKSMLNRTAANCKGKPQAICKLSIAPEHSSKHAQRSRATHDSLQASKTAYFLPRQTCSQKLTKKKQRYVPKDTRDKSSMKKKPQKRALHKQLRTAVMHSQIPCGQERHRPDRRPRPYGRAPCGAPLQSVFDKASVWNRSSQSSVSENAAQPEPQAVASG